MAYQTFKQALANLSLDIDTFGVWRYKTTDLSATPGDVTIHTPVGIVSVPVGLSSVTITSRHIHAGTVPFPVLLDITDDVAIRGCAVSEGSVTIYLTGPVGAPRKLGYRLEGG